jgi:hypothetical protein
LRRSRRSSRRRTRAWRAPSPAGSRSSTRRDPTPWSRARARPRTRACIPRVARRIRGEPRVSTTRNGSKSSTGTPSPWLK